MDQKFTPEQRVSMFKRDTRKFDQNIASKTAVAGDTVQFELPRNRLLMSCQIIIEGIVNAIHASNVTYTPGDLAPYGFMKKATLTMNNGFSPISIDGPSAMMLAATEKGITPVSPVNVGTSEAPVVQGLVASPSAGTANKFRLSVDLANAVNRRDPIGLILLQNTETLANVSVTLGALTDLAPASAGYTFALSGVTVTLVTESFAIPRDPNARPDISIMKNVQVRTEAVIAGENTFRLPVGQTYRKIGFVLRDSSQVRLGVASITSAVEMVLDQAETPIKVLPQFIKNKNTDAYDGVLPVGAYVLDFAENGIRNLGSTRDYVDTERTLEYWLKFTSASAGFVTIWYESLSEMAGM